MSLDVATPTLTGGGGGGGGGGDDEDGGALALCDNQLDLEVTNEDQDDALGGLGLGLGFDFDAACDALPDIGNLGNLGARSPSPSVNASVTSEGSRKRLAHLSQRSSADAPPLPSASVVSRPAGDGSVLLHEWINGAVNSIDTSNAPLSAFRADPENLALSSDEFLASALKVARSLVDQIYQSKVKNSGESPLYGDKHEHFFPSMWGKEWADCIFVHFSAGTGESNGRAAVGNNGDQVDYFAATSAVIVPCSTGQNGEMSEIQCISSLGLVFYQIFSGGEKPREMMGQNFKRDHTQPYRTGHDDTINTFSGALSVKDDAGSGTDPFKEMAQGILDAGTDDTIKKLAAQVSLDAGTEVPDTKRQTVRMSDQTFGPVESLKSKGVPVPLCDLISNMINCSYGGDESYCKLSDVLDDLQLMIDTPATFLHGIDVEKLSTSGLKLNETIFGRRDELASLQESYLRAAFSLERVFGFISGMSGTGKSVLAQRLGNYITQSGGLFLQGKFDQTQDSPLSALATAFGQYCSMMIEEGDTTRSTAVASQLKNVLGNEVQSLAKVIPNLCQFLGLEPMEYGEVQGCVDPQKRLRYLMCQFVDVISSFSEVPVALFIDDVQWADSGSIEIISQLLLLSGSPNGGHKFYFLACMRQEDLSGEGPICSMISQACFFGVSVKTVKLTCMDEGTINSMISGLLCLSPRLARPLSNIVYHKTKGNPFFVSQLILSLNKEGLLRLSLSRCRWEWDEEKISARQLPNDVVEFLVNTICKQPEDVQSALCVLSCFGAQTHHGIIQALETKRGMPLVQPLKVAVAEGLLKNAHEYYFFSHDNIQEAAYQMIKPEDRCLYHFKNGVALVPAALDMKDDVILFKATTQINLGGPAAIEDEEQGLLVANLNLAAGRKAMKKSDYSSAHSFFDHGISFLRRNHWRNHYDLSLQLFDLAAECAFAIGDIESLGLLISQINMFGKSLEDKLHAMYLLVCNLAASSNVDESINKGVEVLSQLGEECSVNPSEQDMNSHLQEVKGMLCNVTDEQLLNYEAMTDRTKLMVMKFFARLYTSMYMLRPQSARVATLKMIKLSLCHGLSPESPLAFTYYGGLLALLGNVREGYRFVKVAFKMLEKKESSAYPGQALFFGTNILCFVEPLHATIEYFVKGRDVAMKSGDTFNATSNKIFHTHGLFWSSGSDLDTVKEGFADCRRLAKQYNQLIWLTNVSIAETSTLALLGLENKIDRSADLTGNPRFAMSFHFQNLYVDYLFLRHDKMVSSAKEYVNLKHMRPFLLQTDSCQTFILGLTSFRIYRDSKDVVWFERGCFSKMEMKQWAKASEWNFMGKLHLLEAEESFSFSDFDSAIASYENAISCSKLHKFLNDEALACELAGYCFLVQGKKDVCLKYLLRAHEKYGEWGACAKSNALFDFAMEKIDCEEELKIPAEPHFSESDWSNARKREHPSG